MQDHNSEGPESKVKKNSSKMYFFLIALAVLVGTNIYYVVEYKNLGKKVELLGSEKYFLKNEVDRIEAELDRLIQDNPSFSNALLEDQTEVRAQIANLRFRLTTDEISESDIESVKFEIQNIRHLVDEYNVDIEKLKKENSKLNTDKEKLRQTVDSTNKKLNKLTGENLALSDKIATASELKISGISINPIQLRSRGREKVESRAKRIDLLRINFNIVENELAKKGIHNLYLRIMDPNGNLITDNKGTFEANDKDLQYTFKSQIDFINDGKDYLIDWTPQKDNNFKKGIYTIVFYSNGATMGRANISLK